MSKRDNVDLETGVMERIIQISIVMDNGGRYEIDVIILATGFHANRMLWPMEIISRNGIRLREVWWEDNPKVNLGIVVLEFPNLFLLYGPNTNLGHGGSAMFHGECQVRYIMKCLPEIIENDYRSLEVRKHVHDTFSAHYDPEDANMVWVHPGVNN